MRLKVLRFSESNSDTTGLLFVNDKFFGYTLEDESREVKVKGETSIPVGIYDLDWQYEDTPMTLRYRSKYRWFHRFLHVKGVFNFSGIYIHPGNNEGDTAGCLLVGDKQVSNSLGYGSVEKSKVAIERLYALVGNELNAGKKVTIEYTTLAKDSNKTPVQVSLNSNKQMSNHMFIITNFLKEKKTEAYRKDTDKWYDYPIEISTLEQEIKTFYIQDAVRTFTNNTHTLTLVLLDKDNKGYIFKKFCKAPEGCEINWDLVTCSFHLKMN